MSITLPPPPREKTSPEQEGQWRETLWRKVAEAFDSLTEAQDAIASLEAPVSAKYSTDAGQTITGADAANIINYEDKAWDTHNAVTTGASWKFTAPTAGKYRVTVYGSLSGVANGYRLVASLRKNAGSSDRLDTRLNHTGGTTSLNFQGSTTVSLAAGDYIHIQLQEDGPNASLEAAGVVNYIVIERTGGP